MIKKIFIFSIIFSLTGCVSTYKNNVLIQNKTKLNPALAVLVGTPLNGAYGGDIYQNSGEATAHAVRSAFMRHANVVEVSEKCSNIECLKVEANSKYGYLVVPVILHWEDRATEWSGIKDKLEIKMVVYSLEGVEVAGTIIYGKSKWATFGGDHPQDLLPAPIQNYVQSLYQ